MSVDDFIQEFETLCRKHRMIIGPASVALVVLELPTTIEDVKVKRESGTYISYTKKYVGEGWKTRADIMAEIGTR